MRVPSIVLLALIGTCALAALTLADERPDQSEVSRAGFVAPKLFDFATFREKYHKHYANAAELVRRAKLFMARAFAVFISSIKYMRRESSKYLKINPRSDWTPEERERSKNHAYGKRMRAKALVPAADPKDVERKMAELLADPEYADATAALGRGQSRKRRSVGAKLSRTLSMDQLLGEPDDGHRLESSPRYTTSLLSNNPDYQQVQPMSQGAGQSDEQSQLGAMSEQEARQIDEQANRGGYLSYLMSSLRKLVGVGDRDRDTVPAPSESRSTDWNEVKAELEEVADVEPELVDKPDQVYLDYRDTGCFLLPKNQGVCGACYIFAVTALMEFHHCRKRGSLVSFSEQYALDCGPDRGIDSMYGCDGGWETSTGEFYSKYGIELSINYPYRVKADSCPYEQTVASKHMGHTRIKKPDIGELVDEADLTADNIESLLLEKGPLFVSINTMPDFEDFGGGVDVLNCDPDELEGHAMAIVGHGVEDGIEYWLIRNSYGVAFGVEGHYKLAKKIKPGCLLRVGWVSGSFRKNRGYAGQSIIDQLKKKDLLAHFTRSKAQKS